MEEFIELLKQLNDDELKELEAFICSFAKSETLYNQEFAPAHREADR